MNLAYLCLNPKKEDTLYYYDGPLVFFQTDLNDQLWFLYKIDDNMDSRLDMYLCYPIISKNILKDMLNNKIPIQDTLTSLKPCYLGIWSFEGQLISQTRVTEFHPEVVKTYLPKKDVYWSL